MAAAAEYIARKGECPGLIRGEVYPAYRAGLYIGPNLKIGQIEPVLNIFRRQFQHDRNALLDSDLRRAVFEFLQSHADHLFTCRTGPQGRGECDDSKEGVAR